MPNKETDINDELNAIVNDADNGSLDSEEWQLLGNDAQDGELLLADVAEAVCRMSSPSEAEAAATDEAWARMSARLHGKKTSRSRLRIAFISIAAAAAAVVLAVLLVRFSATDSTGGQVAKVQTHAGGKPQAAVPVDTAVVEEQTQDAGIKSATSYTVTASTQRNISSASQLIMELQDQGYAVDEHVQRTSQPVRPGELGRVVLPDGTEAYLYASSKLTYPSVFVGDTREVALEGEAYFKVKHDASHPFIIHAANAETRVLGTELDVRACHGEPLHVALITGVAEVAEGGEVCRLKPGEGVTLLNGGLVKAVENMDVYAYALRGILYGDDEPLQDVLQRLARWYGMTVDCDNQKGLERRIHFFMRGSDSPQQAASLLTGMGVCTVKVVGDRFVVE